MSLFWGCLLDWLFFACLWFWFSACGLVGCMILYYWLLGGTTVDYLISNRFDCCFLIWLFASQCLLALLLACLIGCLFVLCVAYWCCWSFDCILPDWLVACWCYLLPVWFVGCLNGCLPDANWAVVSLFALLLVVYLIGWLRPPGPLFIVKK